METYIVSPDEQRAIASFRQSQPADFRAERDNGQTVVIRADIIRRLMLGHPIPEMGKIDLPGTGIRLFGAIIDGDLDLEYGCLADGGALPLLELNECDIPGIIKLTSARLRRLCLRRSRIAEVEADHVHIAGLLDISGIRPFPSNLKLGAGVNAQDLCRIGLRGAHIEDGIEAARAHLVGPRRSENYEIYAKRSAYALDLPEAQINGDIRLFPDFTACGGVNINGANIYGSFQAHGAEFTSEQMYALDASGAHIDGSLALDARNMSRTEFQETGNQVCGPKRFVARGQVQLHNVAVKEDLRLNGARIVSCPADYAHIIGYAGRISAEHMTVGGDASFCAYSDEKGSKYLKDDGNPAHGPAIVPFECENRVDLRGAQIAGDLNLRGACLADELDISSAQVGGHACFGPHDLYEYKESVKPGKDDSVINRFVSYGDIWLDGLTVKGELDFRGAHLHKALYGRGMTIGGMARFSPYYAWYTLGGQPGEIWRFTADDTVLIDSSHVGSMMDMSGAVMNGEFLAPSLHVGGKLLLAGFVPADDITTLLWFDAKKRVNLSGASIKSDFDLTGAILDGGMRFRGGTVDSAMIFDVFNGDSFDGDPKNRVSIDLHNAHVNILSDKGNKKESQALGYGSAYFLRLEGFTYGRFPHHADNESLNSEEEHRRQNLCRAIYYRFTKRTHFPRVRRDGPNKWVKHRLTWLRKQYRAIDPNAKLRFYDWFAKVVPIDHLVAVFGKTKPQELRRWLNPRRATTRNYNPDPYNTLFKYYKRMGAQSLADRVLRHKLRIERKTGNLLPRAVFKLFDHLFGFGLSPLRATFFYIVFICGLAFAVASSDSGEAVEWHPRSLAHEALNWPRRTLASWQASGQPWLADLPALVVKSLPALGRAAMSVERAGMYVGSFADDQIGRLPETAIILPKVDDSDGKRHTTRKLAEGEPDLCKGARSMTRDLSYALELSIPTLNLGEKERCDYTLETSGADGLFWVGFKVVFTLLGWLMTSLTVLTWTGLFRRNVEP